MDKHKKILQNILQSKKQIIEKMHIKAIKSKTITPQDDIITSLLGTLHRHKIPEKTVIIIASKVVAITEGQTCNVTGNEDLEKLVKKEADQYFKGSPVPLSVKNGIFTPWSGIDASNAGNNKVIKWPADSSKTAYEIWKAVKKAKNIKKIGVIIADSFCVPLRKGTISIAIGYAGFEPIKNYKGKKDIFKRTLNYSRQNMADMIASAATLEMGEGSEKKPFVLVSGLDIKFTNKKSDIHDLILRPEECLYKPILKKINV
ncbi:hypothetical protein GF340_01845 [Candidatus Peregrinibacteria bacterium]|nr:hypothetical protein [Candidatus Peregrinibacteria bacterium]